MLEGMDYHFANMCRVIEGMRQNATLDNPIIDSSFCHEAVAYLNRMSQFYYFAKSRFVTQIIGNQKQHLRTIENLLPFRHKHTAHRSIDRPENDDAKDLLPYQCMTLQGGALVGVRRPDVEHFILPGQPGWTPAVLWTQNYPGFQMNLDKGDCRNFHPERDHPAIASEAYEVIYRLMTAKTGASDHAVTAQQ